MKYAVVLRNSGLIMAIVGASMAAPLLISIYENEPYVQALMISMIITIVVGGGLYYSIPAKGGIGYREGFSMVTFGWLSATLFGALPFWLTGTIPVFADAFFESMSGFTTTGASILTDIEALPRSILFWRSLTHWLGGMGIMVLFVAILSQLGAGGMQVFRAEAPGPITEKIKPRISETAKVLWLTYVILTGIQTLLLKAAGMGWFDALTHTFGTMATGGFSTKNLSIGYFQSPAIHWIIILFMFAAGANFSLYFSAIRNKSLKTFWRNEEFRLYAAIVISTSLIIWTVLLPEYPAATALNLAFFQSVSIITTTGFATADYDLWPGLAKGLLFLLMFAGGSAGSTGGGMKISRHLVLLKHTTLQLQKFFHPRAVFSLKIGGKGFPEDIITSIFQFFFLYIFMAITGTVVMTGFGLDITTAFSSVLVTLGNIGPGFGGVGPAQNYSFLPAAAKYFLSFLMLAGRLEIYTVLVLLLPSFWRK